MSSLLTMMILLPLVGSILNGLILRTPYARRAGVIATLFSGSSFAIAVTLWLGIMSNQAPVGSTSDWFASGIVRVPWGFVFDWLTAVMALVVTGIGTVIHIYSIGYMSEDRTPSRYFAYLNLFMFSMLTLICADNLVVLFVGWEGVGLCSYLLIGYWYQDLEKAKAGIKAFVANRVGDAGFLIGMFLCLQLFHTVNFSGMAAALSHSSGLSLAMLNLTALFLFIGATGKSAQIPLYVWLPDAMAGPTPVSALIHAATMVTAGVYLIARMHFLFHLTTDTNMLISLIGGCTSLMAALIATSQNDIKKVLAYSTVSQLGLMFLALGAGAYTAAVFHLMTHAFFKALLFLGAGSVIHALGGEQDIMNMGGLRKELPWTFWTFTIGTVAICGIPPLAGFFSKDTILFAVLSGGPHATLFWALGSLASLLTAFYMMRLYALVFFGSYRGHAHSHESPPVMTIPLAILAVGSCFAGFLGAPEEWHVIPNYLSEFLRPVLPAAEAGASLFNETTAMIVATTLAFVGSGVGFWLYSQPGRTEAFGKALAPLRTVFANKFWVDEIYGFLIIRPFEIVSQWLARVFDVRVIDATVLFPSRLARAGGTVLSFIQWGSAQFYLLVMLLGALGVVWFSLKGIPL